jgi:hypothetical protein
LTPDVTSPSWVADLIQECTTWRFHKFITGDVQYRINRDSPPSFSEDLRLMSLYGFCADMLEEHNVQQTEKDLYEIKGQQAHF